MTEIIATDKRGKVVYHYSTPHTLSQEEIVQDLKDWGVEKSKHNISINGKQYV